MDQQTIWYIAQAIGFLAFGLGVTGFLQKRDQRMKSIMTGQAVIMAVHFAMLGAYGGMVAAGVTAVRNMAAMSARARPLAPVFILIYIVLGYFSYSVWYDVLPIIAVCIGTVAFFYLEGIATRLCLGGATSLWLVHNIAAGSIGPSLMEIVNLGAHFTTIYRLYRDDTRSV